MKYRLVFLVALVAFAVALAVVVGQRLSAEAMAVMVGVVAGVAASIPTSLIIVWVTARTSAASRPAPAVPEAAPRPAPAAQPRLIVVQPQQAGPALPAPAYGYQYPQAAQQTSYAVPYPPQQRTFTVIGQEALEGIPGGWETGEATQEF